MFYRKDFLKELIHLLGTFVNILCFLQIVLLDFQLVINFIFFFLTGSFFCVFKIHNDSFFLKHFKFRLILFLLINIMNHIKKFLLMSQQLLLSPAGFIFGSFQILFLILQFFHFPQFSEHWIHLENLVFDQLSVNWVIFDGIFEVIERLLSQLSVFREKLLLKILELSLHFHKSQLFFELSQVLFFTRSNCALALVG